jgi:opacity protein-like surface antigen
MRKFLVAISMAAAFAAPLQAQQPGQPVTSGSGSFYLSPYAGYIWYGDLFDFGTDEFTNDDGFLWGVQAGFSFSPNFSLIGNFAYNKSSFQVENAGGTSQASGDLGIFMYDGNLQFRLPFLANTVGSWIAPLGQVGIGAIKYTPDTDDFNSDGETNVVFNLGIGGDFQFAERIGMRVMLKDYITSLAWSDIGDVTFDDDVEDNVAHSWALTLGLNFGF